MPKYLTILWEDITLWREGWAHYIERKLRRWGTVFESQKDIIVDILMARRGTYQRPFLMISLAILLLTGVVSAPAIASAYPGGLPSQLASFTPSSAVATNLDFADYGIQTQVSQKPRDQVITYKGKGFEIPAVKKIMEDKTLKVPEWLERKGPVARVVRIPVRLDITEDISEQLIVEHYSR